jgi:phosphate uptake regulator
MGYEIMNITPKTIEIRSVAKIKIDEFDEMNRKIFMILLATSMELHEALIKFDPEKIKSTILRHKLINRYADYCRRIINKFPEKFPRAGPLYSIIENLEKISDQYKVFSELILNLKRRPSKEIIEALNQTNLYLENVKNIFYKYEHHSMQAFVEYKKHLDENISFKHFSPEELSLLFHCKTIIQIIYDMNSPITTLRL